VKELQAMSKVSFFLRSLNSTTWMAMLTLAAISTLPSKTLAQTTTPPAETPQSGCVTGYPDGTYRGEQPVTRDEFAAGMNECLEQINRRPVFDRSNLVTREDIQALIERQRELNAELRGLSDRVGNMTEKQQ
jgi:hypothetical protein